MTTTKIRPAPLTRTLAEIADEIYDDYARHGWHVPMYAEPYLQAMATLRTKDLRDMFYEDSAASVVTYAVSNLMTWRGDVARRVKVELNAALADYRQKRRASWKEGVK